MYYKFPAIMVEKHKLNLDVGIIISMNFIIKTI